MKRNVVVGALSHSSTLAARKRGRVMIVSIAAASVAFAAYGKAPNDVGKGRVILQCPGQVTLVGFGRTDTTPQTNTYRIDATAQSLAMWSGDKGQFEKLNGTLEISAQRYSYEEKGDEEVHLIFFDRSTGAVTDKFLSLRLRQTFQGKCDRTTKPPTARF